MMRLSCRIAALALTLLALTACIHPYTPPEQQGNVITAAEASQIKLGMSKDEVQYIIGEPVLNSDLDPEQWDYVYTYKASYSKPLQTQKLILTFKDDKLVNIDGQLQALGKAQKPLN